MILTLTITGSPGTRPGEATRQVFTEEGGTIGRAAGNSWVLTHNKVSGRHAQVSYRDGVFYLHDSSRNGISVNSPSNRLVRNRPYALKSGDLILIEPYEISVAIDGGYERAAPPLVDPFGGEDPFAPATPMGRPSPLSRPEGTNRDEVDPLNFFDPVNKPGTGRQPGPGVAPVVEDWHAAHYVPPAPRLDPEMVPPPRASAPPPAPVEIPQDYNPLAPDDPFTTPPRPRPAGDMPPRPRARPVVPREVTIAPPPEPAPPAPPIVPTWTAPEPRAIPDPEPILTPAPMAPPIVVPPPRPVTPPPTPPRLATPDVPVSPVIARDPMADGGFADVLSGAGLPGAAVTPDLARNLGLILRVVVSGLMDVLQARQHIKEEFRMRHTIFRPADNNPLKFSANVEDALHNLLVKRNAAYLGPVDAFADAFEDLRNHQLAMLAGMRVAFEAMLAEFDPDKLQKEFDQQIAKTSLPLMPAKMRYWDLFRDRRREIAKDPETAFAELFGEEFAQAYEEQFRTLRAQRRGRPGDTPPPQE